VVHIRHPTEADREAIASLSGLAFNWQSNADDVVLDGRLCAYDRGRLVGTARSIPFDQWFGGARVPCAGIAGVAVQPEHRRRGTARAVLGELLRDERDRGRAVSALYPSTAVLYRQCGFEFAGLRPEFRVAVTDIPSKRLGTPEDTAGAAEAEVTELGPGAIDDVMACFSRFASGHNGPVEAADPAYWGDRVLAHDGEGTHQRTIGVNEGSGLAGYASYFLSNWDADGYRLVCKHLVATSMTALNALLGYFRRFQNAAKELAWYGPATGGPVGLALQANGFSVRAGLSRWMGRVLDVPQALEARGYPSVDGEVVFSIEDPLFPDNAGPWAVHAAGGKVTVAQARAPAPEPLPIGAFSALYTGFATPRDLVLLGALQPDDPRMPFLSALFAGPVPWMPDAF